VNDSFESEELRTFRAVYPTVCFIWRNRCTDFKFLSFCKRFYFYFPVKCL